MSNSMNKWKETINFLIKSFSKLSTEVNSFEVVNSALLPYGFKPHTRSISWIAEQVILQQAKVKAKNLSFKDVILSHKDTDVFDCIIFSKKGRKIYINVKVTNIDGKHNKNDISAAEKLYNFLIDHKDGILFYVVLGIQFKNTKVIFPKDKISVFSPILLPEIYINPKNAKLQAYYDAPPVERTIAEFLELLYLASQKKRIRFPKRHQTIY